VGTCVKKDNGLLGDLEDIIQTAGLVEATSFLVVVAILLYIEASKFEDGNVIAPSGKGLIDSLVSGEPFRQKFRANAKSTGAGYSLYSGIALLLHHRRVLS
jgi:hypothetical protein